MPRTIDAGGSRRRRCSSGPALVALLLTVLGVLTTACAKSEAPHALPAEPTTLSQPSSGLAGTSGSSAPDGVRLVARGGADAEWSLDIEATGRATLVERQLVCPERWEQRCWQEQRRNGTVSVPLLHEFLALLAREPGFEDAAPPMPGAATLMVLTVDQGRAARPRNVGGTGSGLRVRDGAAGLRRAFQPSVSVPSAASP